MIILPQRQPVLLAKQLTSVDVLSGGRLLVGLGVGYLEAELRALGSTLAERGARMDESIAAMQVLWDEAAPEFEGRFVSFANVFQRPLPGAAAASAAGDRRRVARPRSGARGPRARGTAGSRTPEQIADVRARLGDDVEITLTPGSARADRSRAGARVRRRPASRGSSCSRRTRRARRWTS